MHLSVNLGLGVAGCVVALICLVKPIQWLWRCACKGESIDFVAELTTPRELVEEEIDQTSSDADAHAASAAAIAVEMQAPEEWVPPAGLSPGDPNYRERFVRGGL